MSSPILSAAKAATKSASEPLLLFPGNTSPATLLTTAIAAHDFPAIYTTDLSIVASQLTHFRTLLPNITPYYAVKCNPDPVLLSFLAHLGLSFDCASKEELQLVQSHLPSTSLSDRVVFANPMKPTADLLHARKLGIDLMTFDCVEELHKIATYFPSARLLIRIAVDDSNALCPLSSKFGATMSELEQIFAYIQNSDLNLVGVAFHVGSGATIFSVFVEALKAAKEVLESAKVAGMGELSVLDIGGGFPGYDGEVGFTFAEVAGALRASIAELFGDEIRVIAEPGRFFATAAYELGLKIMGIRGGEERRGYYLAEGIYGVFRDAWLLGVEYEVEVLGEGEGMLEECDLWGPSGEVGDVVRKGVKLPVLKVGDWLRFPNLGAYTRSLWSKRGGVEKYRTVYCLSVMEEEGEVEGNGRSEVVGTGAVW